jgi:hypothetical protein
MQLKHRLVQANTSAINKVQQWEMAILSPDQKLFIQDLANSVYQLAVNPEIHDIQALIQEVHHENLFKTPLGKSVPHIHPIPTKHSP